VSLPAREFNTNAEVIMEQADRPTTWKLHELLSEPVRPNLAAAFSALEQALVEFENTRELLREDISSQEFNLVITRLENFTRQKIKLEAFAELSFAADTQNPAVLNLRDRVDQVSADSANRTLFFDMWVKDLSQETLRKLIEYSGEKHYLIESMTRFNPFMLSEAEERLINLKDVNGIEALVSLYGMITSQFTFRLTVDGHRKTMNIDQLSDHFSSPSAEMRAMAYREMFRVFKKNSTVLAQMYLHVVRDWHTEGIELRRFASPISAKNLENDLPDEVVDILLEVCRKNAGMFQRYFKWKARRLGMDRLHRYDIYAPLTTSKKKFTYGQARKLVLDSYRAFSPQVAALAQRVFDEDHIDSETRLGKQAGAFCLAALPEMTPWVMINFEGSAYDVATLAHELGHAVHAMLSSHQSVLTQDPALPLAETASVFAEMQLTDCLLNQELDPGVRRDLLARAIDDAYVTVMRQAYFAIFERDAHEMINNDCTAEELTGRYREILGEQFGDAVDVSEEFQWEWMIVPHLYESPFYTYAYSFGQLLVLSLYQQYRREGESFVPTYLKILSYGGSESPMKILSEAGLDIASPAFWQAGFDILAGMITELEELS
jgi:oligoendopeptidase F